MTAPGTRPDDLVRLLQIYANETSRLVRASSERHGLHTTDLYAVLAVIRAEDAGTPLTAGRLGAELGLSSGATTALVDRLVRHGHVGRDQDPTDRRRVVLRLGTAAAQVRQAFVRPLRSGVETLLAQYSEAELAVVGRFLSGVTGLVAERRQAAELAAQAGGSSTAISRPSE